MTLLQKIFRIVLIIQTLFLGITAALGGIALLAGWNTPPLSFLNGSFFKDYTIPGLSLMVIVGGSGLCAGIMLIRKSVFAEIASISTGIIIMIFEFVEVMVIGSPAGVARTLQLLYFGLGTAIAVMSIAAILLNTVRNPGSK